MGGNQSRQSVLAFAAGCANGVPVSAEPQSVEAFSRGVAASALQPRLADAYGRAVAAADFEVWRVNEAQLRALLRREPAGLAPDQQLDPLGTVDAATFDSHPYAWIQLVPRERGGAIEAFTRRSDGTISDSMNRTLRSSVIGIYADNAPVCTAVFFSPTRALTVYHDAKPKIGDVLHGRAAPSGYHPAGQEWTFVVIAASADDDVVVLELRSGPEPTDFLPLINGSARLSDFTCANVWVATYGIFAPSRGGESTGFIAVGLAAEMLQVSAVGTRHFCYGLNCGSGDSGGAVISLSGKLIGLHLGGWNGADSPPPTPEQASSSQDAEETASSMARRVRNRGRIDAMGLGDAASQTQRSVVNLAQTLITGGYAVFLNEAILSQLLIRPNASVGKRKRSA